MTAVKSGRPGSDWFHRPSLLATELSTELLRGHFAAARTEIGSVPSGWARRELHGWTMRSEPSLPVAELSDPTGVALGWLLGHPIDIGAASLLVGTVSVPVAADSHTFDESFQKWLYTLGGRFAAIVVSPVEAAFVDALGSLPVLFDADRRIVASSPFLLVNDASEIVDSPLVDVLNIQYTGAFYPFGAACLATARHMLPSHALDLSTFSERRIWPAGPAQPISLEDAAEKVGRIVEASITALLSCGDACLGLTAGGDNRLLLACAREVVGDLHLFTVQLPDHVADHDVTAARELTAKLGLDHRVLPWVEPTNAQVREWFYRTGAMCGEERGSRAGPSNEPLAPAGPNILGVAVEIARARRWRKSDTPDTRLGAGDLLSRMRILRHPSTLELAERWLSATPELSTLDTIDLCYLEVDSGGWGSSLTHGVPDAFSTMSYPFVHREIAEAVLGLPYDDRRHDRLRWEVIMQRWPELATFPHNRIPFRSRALVRARRVAQMPGGAIRRIRRKMRYMRSPVVL